MRQGRTAKAIKRHRNSRPGRYTSIRKNTRRDFPFQPQDPTYEQAIVIARGSDQAVQEGQTRFYQNPFARAAAAAFMATALYGCSDSGHTVHAAGLEDNRSHVVAAEADEDTQPEDEDFTIEDTVTDEDGKPAVTPIEIIEVPAPEQSQPNGDYKPTSKQPADESKPVEQPKAEQESKEDVPPVPIPLPGAQPNGDYTPKADAQPEQPKAEQEPKQKDDAQPVPDAQPKDGEVTPTDKPQVPAVQLDDLADQLKADGQPVQPPQPGDAQPADQSQPVPASKPPKKPFKSQAYLRPYDGPHTHRPFTMIKGGFHLDPNTEGYEVTLVDQGGEDGMAHDGGTAIPNRTRLGLHGDKKIFGTEASGDEYKTQTLAGYVGVDFGAVDIEVTGAVDALERKRTDVTQDTSGNITTTTTTDDEEMIDTKNYGAKVGVAVGPVRIYVRGRRETKTNTLDTDIVTDIVNLPNGNITITTDVETEQERTRDIGVIEIGGKVNPQSFVGGYVFGDKATIGGLVQSINGTSVSPSIPGQDYLRFGFGLSLDYMVLDGNGKPTMAFGLVGGPQWLDTEDDELQGFETLKGAGFVVAKTHPHALLFANATYTGDALDFDRDILSDRTQSDATIGFLLTKDAAQGIQVLKDTFSSQGRDALGINANSPGNIALNQQILSTLSTYSLGADGVGLQNLAFLVQGGPVLSEEGDQEYKGRQGNALIWVPFNKGKGGAGLQFHGYDNDHDFERSGGSLLYKYKNHGAFLNVDKVKDSRFGEEQKRSEISFGYVRTF